MNQRSYTSLMIVDDNHIVRIGLRAILAKSDDLKMIAEASSAEIAISLCRDLQPDIVLMDITLPGMGGIAATHLIRREFPHIQVVTFACDYDEELMRSIVEADAIGCLSKSLAPEEFLSAMRTVSAGKPVFSSEPARLLLNILRRPLPDTIELTPREYQILSLIVRGLTNSAIAYQLHVSPFTVKNHVSNLLSKLGVTSRTEAATLALQRNLVQTD